MSDLEFEIPGWQDRLLERVHRPPSIHSRGRRPNLVVVTGDREFRALLLKAARQRGISTSGYARRALASWVIHDLGLGPEVFAMFPAAQPAGAIGGRIGGGSDDGTGYGPWIISTSRPVSTTLEG